MRRSCFVLAVVSFGFSAEVARPAPGPKHSNPQATVQAMCRVAHAMPSPSENSKATEPCSPGALYDVDPAAARDCALAVSRGMGTAAQRVENDAVLAMIFANGKSVPRDLDLAIAYACRLDGTPSEMNDRVMRLDARKTAAADVEPFEICNGTTSGETSAFCLRRRDAFSAWLKARAETLGRDPVRKKACSEAESAEAAYMDARAVELGSKGTDPTQERFQRGEWVQYLQWAMIAGQLPTLSVGDLERAENDLDATLVRVRSSPQLNAARLTEIEDAQQKWLSYRVAFATCAQGTSAGAADFVRHALSDERVRQLQALLK